MSASLCATLAFSTVVATPVAAATPAGTAAPSTHASASQETTVTQLPDGGIRVEGKEGTYEAHFDTTSGRATVTDQNGQTENFQFPAPTQTKGEKTGQVHAASNVACSMLIWAADLVRGVGWAQAIATIVATGPTGAAVLAIMYALGTSAFLAYVGTKC